jgi:hypothetical protein
MEPKLKDFSEDSDILRFTLHGVEVSFANALRRTVLSDIPIVVIETDNYETNQCHIKTNTGRLHNEILKQRLSCIPIHSTLLRDSEDKKALPGNYSLVVDVENKTENVIYVTTEDFRLRDNNANKLLSKEEMDKLFPGLFPKNVQTQSYIDFARLRPKIGNDIPGEKLQLIADFSINSAKANSMYNVVSKCAYGNTPDSEKAATIWDNQESKMRSDGESDADIKFSKRKFPYFGCATSIMKLIVLILLFKLLGIYDNKDIGTESVRYCCKAN